MQTGINNIKPINESEYRLLWEMNGSIIFQDPSWLNLVISASERIEYYGYFSKDVLSDAFAVVKIKGRFFKSYTLPGFTPYLGWIKNSVDPNCIFEFLQKLRPDAMYYAIKQETAGWSPGTTFVIDLESDEDELMRNMRQDKKRNIKKAIGEKLDLSFKKEFAPLQNLVKQTYERQGKQFNGFEQLQKIIETYPHSFQVTVSDKGRSLASLLFVHDKTTAYYVIGGFDHDANNYSAGPYAMWKGIEYSKRMNLKVFDFEGSEISSLAQYFQSFGGVKDNYYFVSKYGFIFSLIKKKR